MKKTILIATAVLLGIGSSGVFADEAMNELNLGLEHNNVLNTPTPQAPTYPSVRPGKSDRLPKSYATAPPQIPHGIADYLPITADDNSCLDCHDRRRLLGKQWKKGKKVPMPDDHYGSFAKKGGSDEVAGSRYTCTQCHTPLSDATPLVKSTF